VFRHQVGDGAAQKSWGVHVARLAGVPRAVLARANQVLNALEARARAGGPDALAEELPLFVRSATSAPAAPASRLHAALAGLDPDALSPRDAQEALYRLKAILAEDTAAQHDDPVAAGRESLS
jgi:DNA mismatch repair protein MutS